MNLFSLRMTAVLTGSFVLGLSAGPPALSADLPKLEVGAGARYTLKTDSGPDVDLVISIADSRKSGLDVEYAFGFGGIAPMWQRFQLEQGPKGLSLKAGYFIVNELKSPEKMTPEYLSGYDGVRMDDFLFGDEKELAPFRKGEEAVEVPAGKVKSTRYEKERNGQKLKFWISPDAKPLGLVKLESSGSKPNFRYTVVLEALVKNQAAKIDPAKAVPLTAKGKSFLALPAQFTQ